MEQAERVPRSHADSCAESTTPLPTGRVQAGVGDGNAIQGS